jgi:hypothetical protein
MSDLLGAREIRELAESLGIRPTKKLGQNFVIDPNTVQRIVRAEEARVEQLARALAAQRGVSVLDIVAASTLKRIWSTSSLGAADDGDRDYTPGEEAKQQRRKVASRGRA